MGVGAMMIAVLLVLGVALGVTYGVLWEDVAPAQSPVLEPTEELDPRLRKALQSAPRLGRDKSPEGRALFERLESLATERAPVWSKACGHTGRVDMVWLVGRDGTVRHTEIIAADLPGAMKRCLSDQVRGLAVTETRQGPLHVRLTVDLP